MTEIHFNKMVTCRNCRRVGYAEDEFTCPYTGLCFECYQDVMQKAKYMESCKHCKKFGGLDFVVNKEESLCRNCSSYLADKRDFENNKPGLNK